MNVQQRRAILLAAAVTLAGAAAPSAADVGLGAAVNGDGTTVLVPIRAESWLIEPQVAYTDQKVGSTTFKITNFGVGLYLRKEVGPLFEAYYGGILGYQMNKAGGGVSSGKTTSFTITPTVGIQHYFSKQFALGVDVGLEYADGTVKQSGSADQDLRNWTLLTRVVVRALFW